MTTPSRPSLENVSQRMTHWIVLCLNGFRVKPVWFLRRSYIIYIVYVCLRGRALYNIRDGMGRDGKGWEGGGAKTTITDDVSYLITRFIHSDSSRYIHEHLDKSWRIVLIWQIAFVFVCFFCHRTSEKEVQKTVELISMWIFLASCVYV